MNPEHITIRAFRAVDDRQRCVRYLMEHVRLLDDIGVTSVIKPDIDWCLDPDVVVVVAEHERFGMVGGLRLHTARNGKVLPFERLLSGLDPDIHAKVTELFPTDNGEISGLWCAHRFAGHGLPVLLTEAGVALASQIGLRTMICFAAEYSAWYAERAGCIPVASLGDKGAFEFPIATIRSHVLVVPDLRTLDHAATLQRHRIISLRLRPEQTRDERPKRTEIQVTYRIKLPGIDGSMTQLERDLRRFAA